MARSQPLWQQAGSYSATLDRQIMRALWPAGGVNGGHIAAVPDTMDVSIEPGMAGVPLTDGQGTALCVWDEQEIVTFSDAPPTGSRRRDLVICRVRDAAVDGGADNDFVFETVSGPDAPSDQYPETPAAPDNSIPMRLFQVEGGSANLNTAITWDWKHGQFLYASPPSFYMRTYMHDFNFGPGIVVMAYGPADPGNDPYGLLEGIYSPNCGYRVPTAGYYDIDAVIGVNNSGNQCLNVQALVNGQSRSHSGDWWSNYGSVLVARLSDCIFIGTGDLLQIACFININQWVSPPNNPTQNYFTVRLRAAAFGAGIPEVPILRPGPKFELLPDNQPEHKESETP